MTDRPPQAFLFWDDSAFPNASSSGYEVAKAIQVFAANIGTIKSLRFYADVAGNQALSPALCSELQCAGVSIIDTVSAGRQGAASKMLLADVFIQALDDPAPCSVMIVISADPDLSYPISALRLRNRRVVLVCPSTVDPRFLQSADGTILEGDLLETRMPASASLQRSTDPPLVTSLQAIPSHFQVMIDLLNDAKSFRGITVYERGLLSCRLLELRPTIFEEAGLSKFVDPMAEYIDRAIALGIVRSSTKHGIQLMPTFQAVVPYNSTLGCCSEKTDEESAGEATFVRQEEEALDGSENSTTDQTSEPMRQPEIPPRASFAEDQALPLLGSIDSSAAAEEAEPIPIAREAQSPYLLCVEAVEACSDSTGLIGAAFFPDDIDSVGAITLPQIRENIYLGLYDKRPQLFYADIVSMFDNAQAHYQQSAEALQDAQEVERAFETAFHKHVEGAKDRQGAVTPQGPHSSNNPIQQEPRSKPFVTHTRSHSLGVDGDVYTIPHPPPQAVTPMPVTRRADLEASTLRTPLVWSTDDLPWPIPTHFHVLVQFLNEEKANYGIEVYSWDLLKTPILMRRPHLLEEDLGAMGRKKNTWNLYLKSAVKLGILSKMKKPRRVSLTQPFLLDWCSPASPSRGPVSQNAASPVANSPSTSAHELVYPQPSSLETSSPAPQNATACDSEVGASPPPSIDIPPHFYVLIDYLKAEMTSGAIVHRRAQIRKHLLDRQPNLLVDAGLSGTHSPMNRYLKAAAELNIIGTNENIKPKTLWLSPEFFTWKRPQTSPPTQPVSVPSREGSSSFPGKPAYFDVLIYYLRERRASGVYFLPRAALFQPLLQRQPNVFLQAGTARYNHPINHYIIKAEQMGIVMKQGDNIIALHPDYC